MIVKSLLWVFLSFGAIWDMRKKSIPIAYLCVFGFIGVFYSGLCFISGKNVWEVLLAILPGCICVLISFVTREQIGMGDGLVILCIGLFCNWRQVIYVVSMSLMILTIVSIVMLVFRKVGRKTKIPFIPFLLAGFTVCAIGGIL